MMACQVYCTLRAFVPALCSAWNTLSTEVKRPLCLSFKSFLNVTFSVRFSLTTSILHPGIPHSPFLLYFSLYHISPLCILNIYLLNISSITTGCCVYLFTAVLSGSRFVPGTWKIHHTYVSNEI